MQRMDTGVRLVGSQAGIVQFSFLIVEDGNMDTWPPSCLRKMAWKAYQGRRKVGFRALSWLHLGHRKRGHFSVLGRGWSG